MSTLISLIIIIILAVTIIKEIFSRTKVLKCFKTGDVNVCGVKGSGKDMLFSWVINKRKKHYVSNIDYTNGKNYHPLEWNKLDIHANRRDLVNGEIKEPYTYPYPDGTDIYLSDVGVLLPSWDCNQLNRDYPRFPLYVALSRHLGDNAIHTNSQAPNRPWDKLREQQDYYILMIETKVKLKKIVTMKGRIYTSYDSVCKKVEPWKGSKGGKSKPMYQQYRATNGDIWKFKIHTILPKKPYNTRAYRDILQNKKEIKEESK